MRLFGLIGNPLTHSFSRHYFTAKFEREGLTDCNYELFPINYVERLPALLKEKPELCGLNVTIPYKQQVLDYLDNDSLPPGLRACNCIRIDGGKLTGYNTDVGGFKKSLLPLLRPHHQQALVLGNGGAAAAVKYVLGKLGLQFKVVSRKLHIDSSLIYEDLDSGVIESHTLIINTTPLGTYPAVDTFPPIPFHELTPMHLVFDLVYNPQKTLFLQKAEERGATIYNGYDMLVLQAEESWRIWNKPMPLGN